MAAPRRMNPYYVRQPCVIEQKGRYYTRKALVKRPATAHIQRGKEKYRVYTTHPYPLSNDLGG